MRLIRKIKLLYFLSPLLSHWEGEFIANMWDGVDGLPDNLHKEQLKDYLYERQIQKIEEIFETYSPHIHQAIEKIMRGEMERGNLVEGWEEVFSTGTLSPNKD